MVNANKMQVLYSYEVLICHIVLGLKNCLPIKALILLKTEYANLALNCPQACLKIKLAL